MTRINHFHFIFVMLLLVNRSAQADNYTSRTQTENLLKCQKDTLKESANSITKLAFSQ